MFSVGRQSIGFWGAWQLACLALFAAINGGRTVSLIVRHGVNPITLRVRKRGLLGLAELTLFGNVSLWALVVVLYVVAPSALPESWVFGAPIIELALARYVGLALSVLAFAFKILAQLALGQAWRLGIDEEHPGELVTDGIYSLIRNPIYLFFDLYFVATFLINGTWFFALSAAFTVANLHIQILNEERHLAQLYGARYHIYRERTARYGLGPWASRLGRDAREAP